MKNWMRGLSLLICMTLLMSATPLCALPSANAEAGENPELQSVESATEPEADVVAAPVVEPQPTAEAEAPTESEPVATSETDAGEPEPVAATEADAGES